MKSQIHKIHLSDALIALLFVVAVSGITYHPAVLAVASRAMPKPGVPLTADAVHYPLTTGATSDTL